jgi:hypothetical protein
MLKYDYLETIRKDCFEIKNLEKNKKKSNELYDCIALENLELKILKFDFQKSLI